MRLRRMAAGSRGWLGAEGRRAMALGALVCRCWQACLPASMRVRWASVLARLGRRAIGRTSRKWHISLDFARAAAGCSMWHAACDHPRRRRRRAQIGMFTQRVRGGLRGGFLLGAARRGVAF